MTPNEHAATLMEMAKSLSDEIHHIKIVCGDSPVEPQESDHAALLAGAAALEEASDLRNQIKMERQAHQQRVDGILEAAGEAKEALKTFAEGGVMLAIQREDFSILRERIVDWHGADDFREAAAALAKLEAL